jgi:hypothetical protein
MRRLEGQQKVLRAQAGYWVRSLGVGRRGEWPMLCQDATFWQLPNLPICRLQVVWIQLYGLLKLLWEPVIQQHVLIQTVDVPSEQPALCLLYSPNEFAVALRGRNRPSGIVHPEKCEGFGPDPAASRAFGLPYGETGAMAHEQDLEG